MKHGTGKTRSIRSIVLVDLAMHTAIIASLALLAAYASAWPIGVSAAIVSLGVAVWLVIYTAQRIIRSVEKTIQHRVVVLTQILSNMQTTYTSMEQQAKELDQRANMLDEQQKAITVNADIIKQYGDMMDDLIEAIDARNRASGDDPP